MDIQFKKGVLELCILAVLRDGDRYGYDITRRLARGLDISDGAVYPVLRRLSTGGYLRYYIKESPDGPARKYYALTDEGRRLYERLLCEWRDVMRAINDIAGGETDDKI